MKKLFCFLLFFIIPLEIKALDFPNINSKNALIYDLTDEKVMFKKQEDEKVDIASLTKLMTVLTAIENIDDFNKQVVYTSKMASLVRWDASIAGLKVGDVVTYNDLLYASMLPSGADATTALALETSGSIENFTKKMNQKALEIGMTSTHYVNVTGLDEDGHYSTASDLLKLLKYALKNEKFKEVYTTKNYTLSNNLEVKSTINKYNNKMNFQVKRIIGSKTGFTLGAGLCIAALIETDDHEVLIILLGASKENNISYNIKDTADIISFLDDNYNYEILVNKGTQIKRIKVIDCDIDEYVVESKKNVKLFLPIDYDENLLKIDYKGVDFIDYHYKKNDKIGEISYYYDGKKIGSENVILNKKMEFNFAKYIKHHLKIVIIILVCLFGLILIMIKFLRRKSA